MSVPSSIVAEFEESLEREARRWEARHLRAYQELELSNPEGVNQYTKPGGHNRRWRQRKQEARAAEGSGSPDGSHRKRKQGDSRQTKFYSARRAARFRRRFSGVDVDEREVVRRALSLAGDLPGHPFRGNQYTSGRGAKPLRAAKGWDKVRESRLYGEITRKAALIAPDDRLYSVHQAGKSALHEDLMDRDPKAFGIEDRGDDTPADMMEKAYSKGLIRVSYNPGSGATDLTLDGNVRTPDDVARLVDEGKLPVGDGIGKSMFNVEHSARSMKMGLTVDHMRGRTSWEQVGYRPSYLSFGMVFGGDVLSFEAIFGEL